MTATLLSRQLAAEVDEALADALFKEFISLQRRFVLCDWEPATLDGGQFAEIASRIIYHVDSGNLNRRKSHDDCLKYVERDQNPHSFTDRRAALHLCKALRLIYKFRSQRGAIHIDPDYTANELDSTLVISVVRWVISEFLRLFWNGDRAEVARAIREIIRFAVPAVLTLDNRYLVLRTDCTVEEEILILLHNSGESGLSRTELGKAIPKSAPSITNSLQRLEGADRREIARRQNRQYMLTPLGSRRVNKTLADKLTIS